MAITDRAGMSEDAQQSLWKKWAWFAGLWVAGVLVVGGIGWLIRWWLHP